MRRQSDGRDPRTLVLLLALPLALIVLAVGGTWVYFNVISDDAPPPLTFSTRDTQTGATTPGGPVEPAVLRGTWRPTSASRVGYRVNEVAFGQSKAAAGSTNAVTGELSLEKTQVAAASFTADLTKVSSDEERRDRQCGSTKPVTFPLEGRRNGNAIEVNGAIPIVFAEWNIPNPSFGPVTTEDNGLLEFLVVFGRV